MTVLCCIAPWAVLRTLPKVTHVHLCLKYVIKIRASSRDTRSTHEEISVQSTSSSIEVVDNGLLSGFTPSSVVPSTGLSNWQDESKTSY
jgi:hypothetical protein